MRFIETTVNLYAFIVVVTLSIIGWIVIIKHINSWWNKKKRRWIMSGDKEYKHILRSCGINADGWMCACRRCGKQFGSYKDANSSDCRDTAKMRLQYIEDLELQINNLVAELQVLKGE